MPKQMPIPATQEDRNLVAEINAAMIKKGLSKPNLEVYLHMCDDTLRDRFKHPEKFTLKELRILKRVLKMEIVI